MKKYTVVKVSAVCAILFLLALAVPSSAGPVLVDPFTGKNFADFGSVNPATPLLESPFNYGDTFVGKVLSQTFSLPGGDYLYLYQSANTGPAILELMGLAPVSFASAGYLTGGEPTGFLADGKMPLLYESDYAVMHDSETKLITYNYSSFFNAHLEGGEHTATFYLVSPYVPTLGEAYVIDGGVAYTDVWAPVPEPASFAVLLSGIAGIGVLRRRK